MTPRPYQKEAIHAIICEIKNKPAGNAVAVLATGAGKSLIIAEAARELNTNTLIFQPSREILCQNVEKLVKYVSRDKIGIYSASMDEKTVAQYTFATIQSVYAKPELFVDFGLFFADEAHGINPAELDGMFHDFINAVNGLRKSKNLPDVRIIGLTATPWRQSTMWLNWGTAIAEQVTTTKVLTRMKGQRESMFWNRILVNVGPEDLIQQGYLCRPKYYNNSAREHKDLPMNKSRSEFDLLEYEKLVQKDEHKILDAVVRAGAVSKSVLVFCASVDQAMRFSAVVKDSAVVSAKTTPKERQRIIEGFKDGSIKTVFNMNCLSVGFDHPALDAIIVTLPTNSITRWVQMCGRGLRIAEGKDHCKIIDFSGNYKRYGAAESFRLVKRKMWEISSDTSVNWHAKDLSNF